nr:MAG TPA: hypothetical protein [Caudoviricetes sp.]
MPLHKKCLHLSQEVGIIQVFALRRLSRGRQIQNSSPSALIAFGLFAWAYMPTFLLKNHIIFLIL